MTDSLPHSTKEAHLDRTAVLEDEIAEAMRRLEKITPSDDHEGYALAAITVQARRAAKQRRFLDIIIRSAHRAGVSNRRLCEAAGINRKAIAKIVGEA